MPNSDNDVHAKILRIGQYNIDKSKYIVQAPKFFRKAKEQELDESTKRIDDLREEMKKLENEIAAKAEKSDKEADEILEKAELETERIVKEAEKDAFERVKKSLDEKESIIQAQQIEADKLLTEARIQADEIINEARTEAEKIRENAVKEGFEAGRDSGFEEGKKEIVSMADRLKSIISVTIKERENILVHSEKQIINLVLTMVRKVVKKLTSEVESVVINNAKEALSITRGAMKVYIHVNPSDYQYTTVHKDELIKLIEGMPEVKIFEDPAVDKGGVYIETDIGEVDAKIATQLEDIEEKIKFYAPMKVKTKGLQDNKEAKSEDIQPDNPII